MSLVLAWHNKNNGVIISDGAETMSFPDGRRTIIRTDCRKVFKTPGGCLIAACGISKPFEDFKDKFATHKGTFRELVADFKVYATSLRLPVRTDGLDPLGVILTGVDDDGRVASFYATYKKQWDCVESDLGSDPTDCAFYAQGFFPGIEDLLHSEYHKVREAKSFDEATKLLRDMHSLVANKFRNEISQNTFEEHIAGGTRSCVHASALYGGDVKSAHISDQSVGQNIEGQVLLQGLATATGWQLVATVPINIAAGTNSLALNIVVPGRSGRTTTNIYTTQVGIALYSGTAPTTPTTSESTIGTNAVTISNPPTGSLTLGLYCYGASGLSINSGMANVNQNVMQIFANGVLT